MIKIGFVGTGNFARQHAAVLQGLGARIVGCYGTHAEKTASFADEFHCSVFQNYRALISRNVIDALYIVIPPFAHDCGPELRAISENIPFLCEKPVGLDLSLCLKVAQKVEIARLITSSGYLLRYEKLFEKIIPIVQRNQISTVRICSYAWMPEVHWWRKDDLSGGMMVESGSHYIDLLRFLFGDIENVASVTSQGISDRDIKDSNMYDSMEAVLKFRSGMTGSIGVTHLLNNIQARNDTLEIYGQDFVLSIDLYRLRYKNEAIARYKEPGDQDWTVISLPTSKYELLMRESAVFIKAIQSRDVSGIKSTYADAALTLKAVLAMNHSAKDECFVSV